MVATAIEADHQAVADQLVATNALNGGDVLEPLGLGRDGDQAQQGNYE